MTETLGYLIQREARAIRVFHSDLDQSWWRRGRSPDERRLKSVEAVIKQATGLQRTYRRHGHSFVELRVRADRFEAAAVAVRLRWQTEAVVERLLRGVDRRRK